MPGLDRSIVEHRLPIKPGYRPFKQAPRRFNPNVLDDVKKEAERLLEAKFIRPCRYAEWISSVVPMYKKNGKLRVCIDFRDLNKATPMDGYPMPIADMLVDAAAEHKVISFMDVQKATAINRRRSATSLIPKRIRRRVTKDERSKGSLNKGRVFRPKWD